MEKVAQFLNGAMDLSLIMICALTIKNHFFF